MFEIIHQRPEDAEKIPALLDKCFGSDRQQKTVYRLREDVPALAELSFVAYAGDDMIGTIEYWPIVIGDQYPALLLGPIAVEPQWQGKGIGVALIRQSLALAAEFGHSRVVLVGDPEYYARFGFVGAAPLGLALPGPVDMERLVVKALVPGALDGIGGMIGKVDKAGA